ncbi:MAG: 3-methyl-2-oxobutanoate hydroxymethyltransferase, partial [Plesiomonas shigelloides]
VPVCAHLGLTPQSVNLIGGYKVQGRNAEAAEQILHDALTLQQAGAQMLVLECVPAALAEEITRRLLIPVIGIGAGVSTDGQILVMHDALGISANYMPKFSKNYLAETGDIRQAIRQYVSEVEQSLFPAAEHTFN